MLVFLKCSNRCCFKNFSDAFTSARRTLEISISLYQCCHLLALFCRHWLLLVDGQLLNYARISSQVLLCADEYDRHLGAKMRDFGQPLVDDVTQADGVDNTEAD